MNAGFVEMQKLYRNSVKCFVFHDVDMVPLSPNILFNCSNRGPVHIGHAVDKFNYK